MNKKKIGAMLSVVAAVTAGVSAYATTIGNLDQDQNTNSLISEVDYVDSYSDYDVVKSEYTNEVKNTKIAENKNATANKNEKVEDLIETAARNAVVEVEASKKSDVKSDKEVVETEDRIEEESKKELNDTTIEAEDIKVAENTEETKETENEEVSEDLDKEEVVEEKPLEVKEADVVSEEDSNEAIELAKEENNNINLVKYVNAEVLNVRSSKNLEDNNIISSLKAGDKVEGTLEDGFLKTEFGYIKDDFLVEAYPETLVNDIENRKAEEAKKAEEARKAEEAKKAEEARKAEEAKKAEEARIAEEAKKAEEAKAQQSYYYSGWVNTSILNVRTSPGNGNVIGSYRKGDWVEGQAKNGWLEVNYNGQTAYISLDFISDTEVAKEIVEEVKETTESNDYVEESSYEPSYEASGSGLSAANIASQFIGMPYIWGASDPNSGFDCSGLTSYAYAQIGVYIPHQSAQQYSYGYSVDYNNLQAGDLVFFSTAGTGSIDHVGIMTSSDGTFVHAAGYGSGVRYDNIYNSYYTNCYIGARRIF